MLTGRVAAVAKDSVHRFSKEVVAEIRIIDGLGVEGDAHLGKTIKHRSRVAIDPTQPNLRQVHLIHSELFEEVGAKACKCAAPCAARSGIQSVHDHCPLYPSRPGSTGLSEKSAILLP